MCLCPLPPLGQGLPGGGPLASYKAKNLSSSSGKRVSTKGALVFNSAHAPLWLTGDDREAPTLLIP